MKTPINAVLCAATALFCVGTANADEGNSRLTPITTETQAAASLHAAFKVQRNVYHGTFALTQPAESIAVQLLDPASSALGLALRQALEAAGASESGAAPLSAVIGCPAGGSFEVQWRRISGTGSDGLIDLDVEYLACREELGPQTTMVDNGPIAIRVERSGSTGIRVRSVRYGAKASDTGPARHHVREFVQSVPEEAPFVEVRLSSSQDVRGRFMQRIGDVGQLEGDFEYDVNGRVREELFVSFPELGDQVGVIERTLAANRLALSGRQGHRRGADGVLGNEDDTFDIRLNYRRGTLSEFSGNPFFSGTTRYGFDNLQLSDSSRLVMGGHAIRMDGIVSLQYPAFAASTCTSGTFRLQTRDTIVNQSESASPPLLTGGALEINQQVLASFNEDGSMDVAREGGASVNYQAWGALEGAIPCFD